MPLGAKSSGGEMHGKGQGGLRAGLCQVAGLTWGAGSAAGVGAAAGVDAPAPNASERLRGSTSGVKGGGGGAAHHVDLAKVQTQQENRLWPFF